MGQLKMTRSLRPHNVLGWSAAVGWPVSFGGNDAICGAKRPPQMKHPARTITAIDNINFRMRPLTFDPGGNSLDSRNAFAPKGVNWYRPRSGPSENSPAL